MAERRPALAAQYPTLPGISGRQERDERARLIQTFSTCGLAGPSVFGVSGLLRAGRNFQPARGPRRRDASVAAAVFLVALLTTSAVAVMVTTGTRTAFPPASATPNAPGPMVDPTQGILADKDPPGVASPAAPVLFEPNRGQADPSVLYLAVAGGPPLHLRKDGFVVAGPSGVAGIGVVFDGHSEATTVEGAGAAASYSSYFGNELTVTGVPHFERVVYRGVYPGIDAVFYVASDGAVEFDFIVAAGADPNEVVLRATGGATLRLLEDGALRVQAPMAAGGHASHLDLRPPVAYQPGLGPVDVRFGLMADGTAGFDLGPYDPTFALTIDPKLTFSSYLGGASSDGFTAVKAYGGYVYATGTSSSGATKCNGAPCPAGLNADSNGLMVAKFDPSATGASSLVWVAVFTGGSATVADIDVEGVAGTYPGGIYIVGTAGTGYYMNVAANNAFQMAPTPWAPTCSPIYTDAILTRLSLDGLSVPYSTYIGGGYLDSGTGVVGGGGRAVIVGGTALNVDRPFPVVGGFQTQHNGPAPGAGGSTGQCGTAGRFGGWDSFIARIDTAAPAGPVAGTGNPQSLLWSTLAGGGSTDIATDVAIDADGAVWSTGFTIANTVPFPTVNPYPMTAAAHDAFVIKAVADPDTDLIEQAYGTLFGGSADDAAQSLAVTGTGASTRVYLVGATRSTLPFVGASSDQVRDSAQAGFVAILDPSQTGAAQLVKSTLLETVGPGVSSDQSALMAVQVDASAVYVQGYTSAGARFPRQRAWPGLNGGANADLVAAEFPLDLAQLRVATAVGSPVADLAYSLGSSAATHPGSWSTLTGTVLVGLPASTPSWPISQSSSAPVLLPAVKTYQTVNLGTNPDATIALLRGPSEPYVVCHVVGPLLRGQPAQFTWTPPAPFVRTQGIETYDALAATDPNFGLDVPTIRWDYDYNGVTPNWHVPSNGQGTPMFTYPLASPPGPRTVLLEVRDTAGLVGRGTCPVTVADRLPVAAPCTTDPSPAGVGWAVQLSAPVPTDSDGTVASRSWQPAPDGTFVSPSSASSVSPTVSFPATGQKTIRVTMRDNDGGATAPLRAVAYGGGQWVAVGDGGQIYTSPTGAAWTPRESGVGFQLNAVAFAAGLWVVAGNSGTVLTSPDGVAWTPRLYGVTANLNGVAYGGSPATWIVVGSGGTILKSTDAGVTVAWATQASGAATGLSAVAATSTMFLAVGDAGRILTSPEGIAWTARTSGTTAALRTAYYQGGTTPTRWAAAGDNGVMLVSPNAGVTWAERVMRDVVHDGTKWIAVGQGAILLTSPDASDWTLRPAVAGTTSTYGMHSVATSGTYTIAVGESGTLLGTSDGVTWTVIATGVLSSSTFSGIVYSPGPGTYRWLAVATSGRMYASTAAVPTSASWTSPWPGSTIHAVAYSLGGAAWATAGDSGFILFSTTATGWSTTVAGGAHLYGIASSGAASGTDMKWVAVGNGVTRSTVTANANGGWSAEQALPGVVLRSVAYNAGTWTAVGDGGVIYTSPDGPVPSWSLQSSPTTRSLRTVTFAAGQWIAMGVGGVVLTSPDAATWTLQSSDGPGAILAAGTSSPTFAAGTRMVAVGASGRTMASTSGIVWNNAASALAGNTATLRGLATDGAAWTVAGDPDPSRNDANTLYSSADGIAWTERGLGASSLCSLTINDLPPPLTCSGPASVVAGTPADFVAAGGTPPYSWTASNGATWDDSPADYVGNPFTAQWSVPGGPYTATVSSGTSTTSCSVTVTPAPLVCSGPSTITFNTAATFSAAGGTGTNAWSADGGATWTGSPTPAAGPTFAATWPAPGGPFTVTLTSGTDTDTCTVTVVDGPPPLACSGPASVTAGTSGAFSGSGGTSPYLWTAAGSPAPTWPGAPAPYAGTSFNPTWNAPGGPFLVTLTDDAAATASCSVQVVPAPNTPPIALDDPGYQVVTDGSLDTSLSVLANDHDNDFGDDAVGAVHCFGSGPANGALTLDLDGTFQYTPAPGYTGPDSFRYRARDLSGTPSASCALVSIEVRVDVAPATAFVWSPASPFAGQSAAFLDLSSDPDGDAIVGWRWTFGDGSISVAAAPSHSYGQPGTYQVCLVVRDSWGLASTPTCRAVSVRPAPARSTGPPALIDEAPVEIQQNPSGGSDVPAGPPVISVEGPEQVPLVGEPDDAVVTAKAMAPAHGSEGQLIVLDASASTGPGSLTFRWLQLDGPAVTIRDATDPKASVSLPMGPATLRFAVMVSHPASEAVATATVEVRVAAALADDADVGSADSELPPDAARPKGGQAPAADTPAWLWPAAAAVLAIVVAGIVTALVLRRRADRGPSGPAP